MQPDQHPVSDNDIQQAGKPASAPTQPTESIPDLTPHDYLHPIVDPPKHAYHPKRVMAVLIVIVAASLLAVIAMLLFALLPANKKTEQAATNTTSTAPAEKPLTAKDAFSHIQAYFKGTASVTSGITLPVKAPKAAYYSVVPETTGIVGASGPITAANSEAQRESIEKSLDYDKFTKQVMADGTNGADYLADYSRPDVVCELHIIKQKDVKADHTFDVKCQDVSVYSEYAKAQSPVVNSYTPLTATSLQYGFVGKPAPKASQTSGYNTAEIEVASVINNQMTAHGKYAMFYQTPDGLWHYLIDHDQNTPIDCKQFTNGGNTALLYAYTGLQCKNMQNGLMQTVVAPKKK